MKRAFISLLLAALTATACLNYDELDTRSIARVRFTLGTPTSGTMTKATDDALQAAVDAVTTYGTAIITLTSTADPTKTYTATPGTDVLLPVGTYTATADIKGNYYKDSPLGDVYTTPCATVTQTVEVARDTKTIPLTSKPTCYALVLNRPQTQYIRINYNNMVDSMRIFPDGEGIGVVFIKPSTATIPGCTAGLVPHSDGGDREYSVSWLTGQGGTHLTEGAWYCFNGPQATATAGVTVTNGTFGKGFNESN